MIRFDKVGVMNFENAVCGARNPYEQRGLNDGHTEPHSTFVFG